jgi:hypothetical protein
VLFEVFSLLEDLLVDFVAVYRRVVVFGEQDDEVAFEFGLDVVALVPVGVCGFVVNDGFDFFGEVEEFVFGVFEVVLFGQGLEDSDS